MKSKTLLIALALLFHLLSPDLFAKGDGVGFWMEGTVSDVTTTEGEIKFRLKGQFWFSQYSGMTPKIITVNCNDGILATVHQADPFFAFTPDWGGGSIQEAGGLLRILKKASERGGAVKFEMLKPHLIFDSKQPITLIDAAVVRATDADLR